MQLDENELKTGLLGYNYFPLVARYADEFPPCFTSTCLCDNSFSAYQALLQQGSNLEKSRKSDGFGVIHTSSTRSNYTPRMTEIPHPLAYCALCQELISHHQMWADIECNTKSAIRVGKYDDDPRIFVMRGRENLSVPVDAKYIVKADIAKFYDSIYTHALPWAIHGIKEAKKDHSSSLWGNDLDTALRQARRKETNGISIGPGTSSICGEILLKAADDRLGAYQYMRFIDDFRFYANSEEQAEEFILNLSNVLSEYRLTLNQRKTEILPLPEIINPDWRREVYAAIRLGPSEQDTSYLLDLSLEIQKDDPESAALRTALLAIEQRWSSMNAQGREQTITRLFNIAAFYPIAVRTLCRLLLDDNEEHGYVKQHITELNSLIVEHSKVRRSDAVTWLLYTIIHAGQKVNPAVAEAVIASKDCLAMSLLIETEDGQIVSRLVRFISEIEDLNPAQYDRDEYWLLYYQVTRKGGLPFNSNPLYKEYCEEFSELERLNCCFIDTELTRPLSDQLIDNVNSQMSQDQTDFINLLSIVNSVPYVD